MAAIEWLLIAIAKCVASDNETMLASLCRDMQSIVPKEAGELGNPKLDIHTATAFIELLCPIKYAIFHINLGLQELCFSNYSAVSSFYNESEGTIMQPIILAILITSETH